MKIPLPGMNVRYTVLGMVARHQLLTPGSSLLPGAVPSTHSGMFGIVSTTETGCTDILRTSIGGFHLRGQGEGKSL
jgi:hypothetical protein